MARVLARGWFLGVLALMAIPAVVPAAPYKLPPKAVVDIFDAERTPPVSVNPTGTAMLLLGQEAYPPIELISRPILRIGGIRIDPELGALQRTRRFNSLALQPLPAGELRVVALPEGARIGGAAWSRDGARFAFSRDLADGVELWIGDLATAKARAIAGVRLSDVTGTPFQWLEDGRTLLVQAVPAKRGAAPAAPAVPEGPLMRETAGKQSQMPTYQDLLGSPLDEALFEHYATAQLQLVDSESGAATNVGNPAVFLDAELSPDEQYLLVRRLQKPYSYRVPYTLFARSTEVWDRAGRLLRGIATLPVSDEIPRQGVPLGPRGVQWQPLQPAALLWTEALDGGDPLQKVPYRDRIVRLVAPFKAEPAELRKVQHRFAGFDWTGSADQVLLAESDRDRRWSTTYLVNLAAAPDAKPAVIFDLSVNDAYNDPGSPVYERRADGERVIAQDGDWIFMTGAGASDAGNRPFLGRFNLKTRASEKLFQSAEGKLESFAGFVGQGRQRILVRSESPTEPPNFFVRELGKSGPGTRVTDFKDPAPQLAGVRSELLRYKREDGVPLSGTLYLPADYKPGTRLPTVIWAYPREFSDAATAGQVRGSPNEFSRPTGASPLFLLTQGYAVLMDATMPVVGDPETMNDNYIEQIVGAARAAIHELDRRGVGDPRRMVAAGHSYGAFMTANLLAHSDLFAAGIARSGAYNRSLTPFGFQSERRSFWEVPQTYWKLSPFVYAPQVRTPLLLIHGEMDNNSGTFPEQSERFYQAIEGSGGTARLVILPHESHGYQARESILHTLAEMIEWSDKYAKNRPIQDGPAQDGAAARRGSE